MIDETFIRDSWFKDHKASVEKLTGPDGGIVWRLTWKKPGTSIYFVEYVMSGAALAVTGDVGDAIYRWHPSKYLIENPFEWLATLNVDYFAEKCLASERGPGYKEWAEETAKESLEYWISQGEDAEDIAKRRKQLTGPDEGSFAYHAAFDCICGKDDWAGWLKDCGEDIFGPDCWFEYFDIGMDVSLRCRSHLIGIKMAVEQLQKESA